MKKWHLAASSALAAASVLASFAPAALAIPPDGPVTPIPHCPPGTVWDGDICVRPTPPPPPPPPSISPMHYLDVAQQTTDRTAIHIRGWAADGDAPTTALRVRISIDGGTVQEIDAGSDRPDVAQVFPQYGSAHGYDLVVPAAASAQQVCVTAVNVGSGSDSGSCKSVDHVTRFEANSIGYDVARAKIASAALSSLDKVSHTNDTTVQQQTVVAGSKTITDARSWTDTVGIKIGMSVSGGVSVPLIADGKVSVSAEASATFTQNGSSSESRTFSWSQPVVVPARSRVVATIAVTRTKLVVPYTMIGDYVYESGARAAGSVSGKYSGVDSHDLEVKLKQYNLDGTPAARPVAQPAPAFLRG